MEENEDDEDPHNHEHDDNDHILGVRLDNIVLKLSLQADRSLHQLCHGGAVPGPQPDHVGGEGSQVGQHS